ncbi:cytochrome P450 [Dictyobacter formicarum]|uniref:Hypothetical cytochrome P450 n=1 Tax=Dictyobacter formicarum TaxID=2778368 RepID=A0ABQ3VBZ6_9CHLR|nr:cytochrome P450 [Dictyobacter formicarum]GHO83675.1 hypothetical cytochrome P450 [Dictyobacter formicarum]
MTEQLAIEWKAGVTDAPLAPMVNPEDLRGAHNIFVEQYRKLGPIFRLPQRSSGRPLIVLAGPDANAFIARYEDEFFTTQEQWQEFDAAMHIEGTTDRSMARDGQANKQRRAQASRTYSRTRVLDQLADMVDITIAHTQSWQPGTSIAVRPAMQRIVSEQLGQLLVHFGPGEYLQDFIAYLDTSIKSAFGEDEQARQALSAPEFLRAKERVLELGRAVLEEHRRHPRVSGKPDMIDEILERAAQDPEHYPESALELAGLGPFLVGLDTVANTCSFMTYALLKNPDVLDRVLQEVDAAWSRCDFSWETLKQLTTLHGAAMETLRLYPVATGHRARVAQPLSYAGYQLSPGDDVFVAMTVSHFLPELYPEPERFDIDRYREPRNEHRQRGAYFPFGLGNHTCLGAGIAEIEIMVTMATLFHRYQLSMDPVDYQLSIEHDPTPAPGKNFRIKVDALRHSS